MQIKPATPEDVEAIAPLFAAYRQFYGYPYDIEVARTFLGDRVGRNESVVLIAVEADGACTGFVQLYPTFSSLDPGRSFILNDLYVVPQARKSGIGAALLKAAEHHARSAGAVGMVLSTAVDNHTAQRLYEKLGWMRDTAFLVYERKLD